MSIFLKLSSCSIFNKGHPKKLLMLRSQSICTSVVCTHDQCVTLSHAYRLPRGGRIWKKKLSLFVFGLPINLYNLWQKIIKSLIIYSWSIYLTSSHVYLLSRGGRISNSKELKILVYIHILWFFSPICYINFIGEPNIGNKNCG